MNSDEARFRILKDAYDRTKAGQTVLQIPEQYAVELGIPENEIKLHLTYLIQYQLLSGTVETMTGGLVIYHVVAITAAGIQAVESWGRKPEGRTGNTTVNVHGVGNQVAVGNDITQSQSTTIDSFKEAYTYIDTKLSKEQSETILPLLKELEVEIGRDAVTPSNLKKVRELLTTYGPIAIPVSEFILRAIGWR